MGVAIGSWEQTRRSILFKKDRLIVQAVRLGEGSEHPRAFFFCLFPKWAPNPGKFPNWVCAKIEQQQQPCDLQLFF